MVDLSVTVLGSSPAAPNVGGHCAGYLVRAGESRVLVDFGSGTIGNLRRHVETTRLDAIVLSHLHADHYLDIVPLYYSIRIGDSAPRPAHLGARTPLWLPPGGIDHFHRLAALVGGGKQRLFEEVFELREYRPHEGQPLGGLDFTFVPVQHYVPSHAMRIRPRGPAGGPLLVYSSDVGPCDGLLEAARDADLLLCEAALREPGDDPNLARRGHMSAAEAGEYARRAAAKRLLLTHCGRGERWDGHHREAAARAFDGPIELADENRTYRV